jgi:hypothetical protein
LGLRLYKKRDEMIIGLSGWARSGKDTVANHLVDNFGFVKVSFAEPMREALVRLNPSISINGLHTELASAVRLMGWENLKSESPDVRGLMQRFGTEIGREMFGENFWVDLALSSVKPGANVVIPDCRYPNEADAIKAAGGVVWRIDRKGVGPANEHDSERALDSYEFDRKLTNYETFDVLNRLVDDLVASVL